jgi:murein DD-endopeptidase MepM/ murein hydrolase activator NlpD
MYSSSPKTILAIAAAAGLIVLNCGQSAHADNFNNGDTVKITTPQGFNVNLPYARDGGMINTFEPDNTEDWKYQAIRSNTGGIKFKRIGTNHLITAQKFPSSNLMPLESYKDVGGEDPFQTWVAIAIPNKPTFVALCLKAQQDQCMNVPNSKNRTKLTTYKRNLNDPDQMFRIVVLNGTTNPPPASTNRDTPFLPFDSGVTLPVTQGYANSLAGGSHTVYWPAYNRYAVDFGAGGKQVDARASRYGEVVYAGVKDGGYGNVVVVKYSDGKYGRYLHLNSIYVRTGSFVAGGQGLGRIGQTGNADGPHLHYAESLSAFGECVELPRFADAPNVNFLTSGFSVTSNNPDGRR